MRYTNLAITGIIIILAILANEAQAFQTPIVDGQYAYVNDSKAYLATDNWNAYGSEYLYFTAVKKVPSGTVTLAFLYPDEQIKPTILELFRGYYYKDYSNGTVETYENWTSMNINPDDKISGFNIDGMNTARYKTGVNMQVNVTYRVRIRLSSLANISEPTKYAFAIFPDAWGSNIAGANAAGQLYVLDPFYGSTAVIWNDDFDRADNTIIGNLWNEQGTNWAITSKHITAPGSSATALKINKTAQGDLTGILLNDTSMTGLVFSVNSQDGSRTAEMQFTSDTQLQYHTGAAQAACGGAQVWGPNYWLVVNRSTTNFMVFYINHNGNNFTNVCNFTTTRNWMTGATWDDGIQIEDQGASTKSIKEVRSAAKLSDFNGPVYNFSFMLEFVSPTQASSLNFYNQTQNYIQSNTSVTVAQSNANHTIIWLYNATGLYSYSNQSINLATNTTQYNFTNLAPGTYTLNATLYNRTAQIANATSRTYTIYSFLVNISKPTASEAVTSLLNVSYNATTTPGGAVTITGYNITLLNSTLGRVKQIGNSTSHTSYSYDPIGGGVAIGRYYVNVTVNDNNGATYTVTTPIFNVTADSMLNITATSYKTNTSISSFNVSVIGGGVTTNYGTSSGLVQAGLVQGTTYTITVSATNYTSNTTSFTSGAIYQSLNFTLYGFNSVNIRFYDEANGAFLNFTTVYLDLIGSTFSNNYTTTNGSLFIELLNASSYTARYWASGYTTRFYYFNVENDTYQMTNLYLINNSGYSNITIYVIDEVTQPVEAALVKALKYNLSGNTYTLQEIGSTDSSGKTIMTLTKNNEYYKFMIEYNGELLKTTNPAYITTDSVTIQIDFGEDFGEEYFKYDSITGTVVFNTASDNFRLDYNDASLIGSQYCLYVYKNLNTTLFNSSCSTSASGTILVGVTALNGTVYYAKAYYLESSVYKYLAGAGYEYPHTNNLPDNSYGLFLQTILTLVFALTAVVAPWIASLTVPFSLIIGHAIGLNQFTTPTLTMIMVLGFIMAVVLKVKR